MLSVLASLVLAGCSKDTTRIRRKGVSDEDRTFVRTPGLVCVQSLNEKGALQESCRAE